MAFAGVEEADKTNRMENRRDKVLVSRVALLAAWGHAGARLSRLAVITLSSDSHQRSSFSSLTPVAPADWVTGGLVIHQVELLWLLLGFSQAEWMLLR